MRPYTFTIIFMKRLTTKQSGMSLLSVMMAAAIGAIITLSMAALIANMLRSENGVKYRSDADTFNEELRATLSSPVACLNSFGGLVADASANHTIASLKDDSPAPGAIRYSAGATYGDNSVRLNSMTLGQYIAGGAPLSAQMTLRSQFATAKEAAGPQVVGRNVNISLHFDPTTKKITSCIALAKMSDGIWQRSLANVNTIFFSGPPAPIGGKVGIGTDTPQHLFEVVGKNIFDAGVAIRNTGGAASTWASLTMQAYTDIGFPAVNFYRSRGTSESPNTPNLNDVLGMIGAFGWNGVNYSSFNAGYAAIGFHADGPISSGNEPASIRFYTTPSPTGAGAIERMRISSDGNVGINVLAPAYNLHVAGTAGLSTGTAWTNASDARLKDLHGDYEYGLKEIMNLRTVRFTYKKDNPLGLPSDKPLTGFVAQQVRAVIPDAVSENKNGFLELNADPIHWATVNAVQDLNKKLSETIDQLQKENAAKSAELAALKMRMDRLEQALRSRQ